MTALWLWFVSLLKRFAGPLILITIAVLVVFLAWIVWNDGMARKASREAALARGAAVVSAGGDNASRAALEGTAAYGEREATRQGQERDTRDEILAAPDAGAPAGAAGDAGLAGLCKRAVYRDHPRCAGLRGTYPAPASGGGKAGGAAGRQ